MTRGRSLILISRSEVFNYEGHKGKKTERSFGYSMKKMIRMEDEEMLEVFCIDVGKGF